jgi:hypothetical protein
MGQLGNLAIFGKVSSDSMQNSWIGWIGWPVGTFTKNSQT